MNRFRYSLLTAVLALSVAAPSALALGEQPTAPVLGTPPTVYSPDDVIVQWAPGADRGDRVEARENADVDFQRNLGNREFQLVEVEPGQTPSEAVAELEADPAVVLAERDGYNAPDALPNDPLFNQLWGLSNLGLGINGFSGAIAGDDISAIPAWDRTAGSPSVVIADIDSGYRFTTLTSLPSPGPTPARSPATALTTMPTASKTTFTAGISSAPTATRSHPTTIPPTTT